MFKKKKPTEQPPKILPCGCTGPAWCGRNPEKACEYRDKKGKPPCK